MYKIGDEVFIKAEITDVHEGCERPYYVASDFCSTRWVSEEKIIPADKTYSQGLADAWELAKRLYALEPDEREKMLGYQSMKAILEDLSAEYVADKNEAYEREKEIKVGDVVYGDDEPDSFGVVTLKDSFGTYVMWKDGSSGRDIKPESLHKTGKHIDIEGLLRQIGE